jgi:Zn finger protein HypA/HybF involved in hydrogenase expression
MPDAKGIIDRAPIEFECPECNRKVKTTIGEARRNRSIRCPGGHTIKVDGSQLDRETRKIEQQLGRVGR